MSETPTFSSLDQRFNLKVVNHSFLLKQLFVLLGWSYNYLNITKTTKKPKLLKMAETNILIFRLKT
jgi:hypothetical protein